MCDVRCVMCGVCVCVFVFGWVLMECVCVGLYRKQHWTCGSTIHWSWSQVTYITCNTEFESWVMLWCCDVCVCVLIVCVNWMRLCVLGCTDANIGDVGAQSIGDSLKSLTSLTTLNLSGDWCCDVCGCVCVFVCWPYALIEYVCVCWVVQTTRLDTLEHNPLVIVSSHLHHLHHWIWAVSDVLWCCDVCVCLLIVCVHWIRLCVLGCTDANIGDVGAQSIGDGLKSLTSLTTLYLRGEWCVVYAGVFVCWLYALIEYVCVCWVVQATTLDMWEHSPLVMVSSHLHHLQHWVWVVSDVVMCACVCWLYALIECVCVLGCSVNNIGDIGAQSIGDGLKSLTSLTTLNLSCEWCVMYAGVFVCVDCMY